MVKIAAQMKINGQGYRIVVEAGSGENAAREVEAVWKRLRGSGLGWKPTDVLIDREADLRAAIRALEYEEERFDGYARLTLRGEEALGAVKVLLPWLREKRDGRASVLRES